VEVDLRHESGSGEKRDRIELTLSLGGDLAPEQQSRLREISQRCPVHRMLVRGVDIEEHQAGARPGVGDPRQLGSPPGS